MFIKCYKSLLQRTVTSYFSQSVSFSRNLSFTRSIQMADENVVVTVKQGQLCGKSAIDHDGNMYYSFQGIPYAKPPLGELRFRAPQPPEQWSGIREATVEGPECYAFQRRLQRISGSEDCLYLNVYTQKVPSSSSSSNLKPVMVWIHGGAFVSGSGSQDSYGPDFLMPEDVVIVLINYRYGLLGFLSFKDPSLGVPGNAGLKDQVFALKWVKENIEAFSGDPNNVTIFGESSGGASIHYLMLSPMAKGLFHKAIVQSGSALCCWARGQYALEYLPDVMEHQTQNEQELLKVLQEMSVEKLYDIQKKLPDIMTPNAQRSLGPVIEKPSNEPGFLLKDPVELIQSGNYNKVPMIVGFNSREGMMSLIFKDKEGNMILEKDFDKLVPYTLNVAKDSELHKKIGMKIKKFYFGEEEPSVDTIDQYTMMLTDSLMVNAINQTVHLHSIEGSAPVYYYRMSIESKLNKYKRLFGIRDTGVCHADDLGYLFKTPNTPKIRPDSVEDVGMRRFVKLWTNFAKYGDPNSRIKTSLINITWKPVNKNELNYLDIGENLTVGINPEAARMAFWTEIAKFPKE